MKRHFVIKTVLFLTGLFLSLYLLFWLIGLVLNFAPEPIGSRALLFKEGASMTMSLTLVSGAVGIFIGIFLGLSKISRIYILKYPANTLLWLIRGTPLLVQILFVYYALPAIFPILKFNEFTAAVIALALNVGAYNAEAIRAGILAVPKGQTEAARSLGFSRYKTMRFIVLPQALKIVVPPLVNNIVALLKDSSLVSAIGLLELTLTGNRITSETFRPAPVLITVAFVYLVLTTFLTFAVKFYDTGRKPT